MNVNIEATIKKICKNVKFMQPLYEAVINSFEANATKITIEFIGDLSLLNGVTPNIDGFKITDNGDGFNENNINAFLELWTENKISIGCKGSGRFTWLAVYSSVSVDSYLQKEQKHVSFIFNKHFNNEINKSDSAVNENSTTIIFKGVTSIFFNINKRIDKRTECDLELIKNDLLSNIFTKLFWLKEGGIDFEIILKFNSKAISITSKDLPSMETEEFKIDSEISNETYSFDIHYHFVDDNKGDVQIWLCSKDRSIIKVANNDFGIYSHLPNKTSAIIYISSDYFNDKSDDSRTDMPELFRAQTANIDIPITYNQITTRATSIISNIIIKHFPAIIDINESVINEAKKKAPHLIPFMKTEGFVVADLNEIIKSAKKKHENVSEEYEKKMDDQLKNGDVNSDEFKDTIDGVSISAAVELGKYIYYREKIIDALKKTIEDETTLERNVHQLFVPQKSVVNNNIEEKIKLSNLWLLDDKFMSFSIASSDKEIKKLKKIVGEESFDIGNTRDRPDLLLFFNNPNSVTDFVVVELKGPNAGIDELTKSLTEMPRNIKLVRDNFEHTNMAFGYIIGKITDEFAYTLESMSYSRLFTNEEQNKMFYIFNPATSSHIYVIDYDSIIKDARARNSTFLSILEKTNKN